VRCRTRGSGGGFGRGRLGLGWWGDERGGWALRSGLRVPWGGVRARVGRGRGVGVRVFGDEGVRSLWMDLVNHS
jgi:hypothetical protein